MLNSHSDEHSVLLLYDSDPVGISNKLHNLPHDVASLDKFFKSCSCCHVGVCVVQCKNHVSYHQE